MRHYRFLSFLLTLCLLLSMLATFAGCARGGSAKTEPAATTEATAAATTEAPPVENAYYSIARAQQYIKQIGRTQLSNGNILADWTASGIEFEYKGYGDLSISVEKTGNSTVWLVAEVDGNAQDVAVQDTGVKNYRIATDLADGVHHVLVRRRTMATFKENGAATGIPLQFKGIQMTGRFLAKPADNTYKVAFIGDSITCGAGIETPGEDGTNHNGLSNYAIDLCTRENFDYDICCITAIGVYASASQHDYKTNTMTKYYPYYNYYRSTDITYTPSRKADLVIVNLNTNDHNNTSSTSGTDSDKAAYQTALRTFISEIRAAHGQNVKIVWVVGMMIDPNAKVNQWLNEVFDSLGGESAGLYRITVATDVSGLYSHPKLESHLAVSQSLSAFIRQKNLLNLPASSN